VPQQNKNDLKIIRIVGLYYRIVAITLVSCLLALYAINEGLTVFLRKHPDLLMTEADRINETTRSIREKMISPEKALDWYDLERPEQVAELWEEFYQGGSRFESYTHFRPRSLLGNYYKVTEAGYRMTRDPGPWPPSLNNFNVFFFGGSTAFGVGPAWATVASYLQDAMNTKGGRTGRKVYVYNFGRSGYLSTQEIILLQNLLREGYVPNMVVFLDGLNDFCWHDGQPSSWQMLARYFDQTNENYRAQMAGYGIVTRWDHIREFFWSLPVVRALDAVRQRARSPGIPQYQKATETATTTDEKPESDDVLNTVIARYFHNLRQAEAISRDYGIIPVFVWQPIPTYGYDTRYHLFKPDRLHCHVNSKIGYPMMAAHLTKMPSNRNFIWAADLQQELKEPLYIDAFHYTAPMARRLAQFIYKEIRDQGLSQ
jgi:lysophospholipase L1-like esterase